MDTYLYTQIKRKEKETLIVCVCFMTKFGLLKNILSMGIKRRKPAFRKKDMPKRVV